MHDRALQGFLTFCYHKCHTPPARFVFSPNSVFPFSHMFHNSSVLSKKQHVIFNKTTRRFQQNNTSFSIKQHVIFNKTTRHFQQNKPTFSVKQADVFCKSVKKYYKSKVTNTITRSYPKSVTLVTAKNTKSLWYSRVRVRERNKYHIH